MTLSAEPMSQALRALQAALDEIGAPAMIIGGIAVIARGVARQTQDIDALIWGANLELEHVLETLAAHGVSPRIDDSLAFARQHQVLLLRHAASGTPLELSIAWLPFEEEALRNATRITLGDVDVRVATAEDLVIFKAVAWRDRDRADIERLLLAHSGQIDLGRVRRLVTAFAEALDEPERVFAFEALVQRLR